MPTKEIYNPSSKSFGKITPSTRKELEEAKNKNRRLRNMVRVYKVKRNSDGVATSLGTCWMCWLDITKEGLGKYRTEPFSLMTNHKEICPLCGYKRWRGRIWYPFRFVRGYIGNPSSRYGFHNKKTNKRK